MTWYFYSVPNSTIPSGYFRRIPQLLADISRKEIMRFRIWQGTHDAPIPLNDGPEPHKITGSDKRLPLVKMEDLK